MSSLEQNGMESKFEIMRTIGVVKQALAFLLQQVQNKACCKSGGLKEALPLIEKMDPVKVISPLGKSGDLDRALESLKSFKYNEAPARTAMGSRYQC